MSNFGFSRTPKTTTYSLRFFSLWCLLIAQGLLAQDMNWNVGLVDFIGNKSIPKYALIDNMRLKPSYWYRTINYSFSSLVEDIAMLENFYHQKGFRLASITIDTIQYDSTDSRADIMLRINEGPLYTIESIILTDTSLYRTLPIEIGDPADSSLIDQALDTVKAKLGRRGFLLAQATCSLLINRELHKVTLFINSTHGPHVVSGDIEVYGNESVDEETILRELTFTEGDSLSTRVLSQSLKRLYATGLFTQIKMDPIDTTDALTTSDYVVLPVYIFVTEADPLAFLVGGGYSAYENVYGSAQMQYKNLFGKGHRTGLEARLSSVNQGIKASYFYPWLFSIPLDVSLQLSIDRRVEEDFEGVFYGSNLLFGNRHGPAIIQGWSRNEYAPNLDIQASSAPKEPTQVLGFGFGRDTRINTLRPGHASRAYAEFEIGGLIIPKAYNFIKSHVDVRVYRPFFIKRLFLSSAIFAGIIEPYGNDNLAPPQELYRIGREGVRPVRGYDEDEFFTVKGSDTLQGGSAVLVANLADFIFVLAGPLSISAFADAGGLWTDATEIDLRDIKWSFGPGIRLDLAGIVARFDYGFKIVQGLPISGKPVLSVGLPF